jgi:hypothetical protein
MVGDDGQRPTNSIVVSARRLASGNVRICVDRVRRVGENWVPAVPSTYLDVRETSPGDLDLTDERLASLRLVVVAELISTLDKQSGARRE